MTPHRRGRVEEEEAGEVVAFMAAAAVFTAAEDFTVVVSAAVECGWAAGDLSALGPVSPVHFQGRPSGVAAGLTHIADIQAAARA